MARYTVTLESAAAIAADTGFCWTRPIATVGHRLRRITVGLMVAGGGTPTNMQCQLGVARCTNAGTTPATAITPGKQDVQTNAAQTLVWAAYTTPPTTVTPDLIKIPFNSQAGADLPYEGDEYYAAPASVTDGFAFINRDNALPANHKVTLTLVFEE